MNLRTLDYSILQQCMHCGMCLPSCPTYDATKRERHSPRGRIAMMRAIADGELEITPSFADEMSYCLGCLACQTACPAGVNYAELFETARGDIASAELPRSTTSRLWRRATFGYLFTHPRALRGAARAMRWYQQSGLQSLARRARLTRLLPHSLRRAEPMSPAVAASFSNALIKPEETPATPPRYTVALLTGCVQDVVFPDINRDTADVLLANGCAVETPPVQPCCGSLHAHNGETGAARTLARRMIDLFPPDRYDAIITNAGGCGSHLRHYGALLADDAGDRSAAHAWDRKVRDIHEWLVEIGCRAPETSPFDRSVTVTYHESCHLAHGQKITRQPRALLRLLPGMSFVELPESSWCCGSAGVYALTQPEQAEALLQRKVARILSTGAEIVVMGNPGCHLQVARGLATTGSSVQVMHTVSLLARAYRRSSVTTSDRRRAEL